MAVQPVFLLLILAACTNLALSQDALTYYIKEKGGELTLVCTAEDIEDTELSHWVLNDLTTLFPARARLNDAFEIIDKQLHILQVDENTFGDYFCVLRHTDQSNGNQTMLYFKSTVSKYLESLWDQFRSQMIVGVVAAVMTLVMVIGLGLVYKYRWRPEKQDIVAVNGGYDAAAEKKVYSPTDPTDKGQLNESFVNSAPDLPEKHTVIVDDTRF